MGTAATLVSAGTVPAALDACWGWAAAALLFVLQLLAGGALLGVGGLRDLRLTPLARLAFAGALGTAATTAAALLLILAGAATPAGVTAAAAAGFLLCARRGAGILPRLRLRPGACLLALALAAPYLVQTALPETDWDSASYHVPTARMLLDDGVWTPDPCLVQYSFPASIHALYAALLAIGA